MKAIFNQIGDSIDHTPGSAVAPGDVIVQGNLVGVAKRPIAANVLGAIAVRGVFTVQKAAVVHTALQAAYWDADGNPVGGTPGDGAVTNVATGNTFMGFFLDASDATGTTAKVVLMSTDASALTSHNLSELADVGALAYTAGRILVADGDSYEEVAVSGDATLAASGAATVNAAIKEQVYHMPVAGLGADADLAATVVFAVPRAGTIQSIGYLPVGTDFGTIDDADTSVIAVTDAAGNAIASKTFNTATQPTANAINSLGALDGTNKVLTAGEAVKLAITNGTTAKMPGGFLVIVFIPTNA